MAFLGIPLSPNDNRTGQLACQVCHAAAGLVATGNFDIFATVALQMPLSFVMSLRHAIGRPINVAHIYSFDGEVHLAGEITDAHPAMAGLMPEMPPFGGVACDFPADSRDSRSPAKYGNEQSTIRIVGTELQHMCLNQVFTELGDAAAAHAPRI